MAQSPVIIVGGGIAGLAAAIRIGQSGLPVIVLEARNRIGGRVFTQLDQKSGTPIELGAEFIHGLPQEIFKPLQNSSKTITEVDGESWCAFDGQLSPCNFFSQVESILDSMDDSLPDESFLDFLERRFPNSSRDSKLEEAKNRAIGYVSGFNASDPALVGVHWLVAGMRAEEKNQGHRAFRSQNGYADLIDIFQHEISRLNIKVRLGTIVESITWKPGFVQVNAHSEDGLTRFTAGKALITLPISLLKLSQKPGGISFTPSLPQQKIACLDSLEMGKVIRIVLRFRRRFWESISANGSSVTEKNTLDEMSFLFSEDESFPTWWTEMPRKNPVITGWAPFRAAELSSGQNESDVVSRALKTLSQLLGVSMRDLEGWLDTAHLHDWQTDPFSRGAYSYGKVGAVEGQQILAQPIENTLFFAGEATDTSGNNGTVHGAIASGHRAATEIIVASRQLQM
jgi:monoamine oxidase